MFKKNIIILLIIFSSMADANNANKATSTTKAFGGSAVLSSHGFSTLNSFFKRVGIKPLFR